MGLAYKTKRQKVNSLVKCEATIPRTYQINQAVLYDINGIPFGWLRTRRVSTPAQTPLLRLWQSKSCSYTYSGPAAGCERASN